MRAPPRLHRPLVALLLGALALVACGGPAGPAVADPRPTVAGPDRATAAPTMTAAPPSPVAATTAQTPELTMAAPTTVPAIVAASPTPPGQARKRVPVRVLLAGQPAAGVRLEGIVITPEALVLSGDPGLLGSVSAVATELVDLRDRQESFRRRLTVRLPIGVQAEQATVEAEVKLAGLPGQVEARLPLVVRGLPLGWRAQTEPAAAEVILEGPLHRLRTLPLDSLRLEVAVTTLGPGRHKAQPTLAGPGVDGLRVEVRPAEVIVEVDRMPVHTAALPPAPTG